MKNRNLEEFLKLSKIEYVKNEPLKQHTSFKIGGNADFFITVKSTDELKGVLEELNRNSIPFFIIGKGSNLLVSDDGIGGAVISLSKMEDITVNGDIITAQAGAGLASVCHIACKNNLSGLEFAFGIPGSVGGALYMNAGAYGGEMSQVVTEAEYITESGEIGKIDITDMKLGYRKSIFKEGGRIITSVSLKLSKGEQSKISEKMEDFLNRRKEKQPLEYPSAGSTFKRPEGYFAGALIEKNNLKGKKIGGAMVSEKHAGFIINYDNASAADVKSLIKEVQKTVLEADGVSLETEVIFVGR